MSRGVRGPTSALTEFLRERNITVQNANRYRRRDDPNTPAPVAVPVAAGESTSAAASASASSSARNEAGPSRRRARISEDAVAAKERDAGSEAASETSVAPRGSQALRRAIRKSASSMSFAEEEDDDDDGDDQAQDRVDDMLDEEAKGPKMGPGAATTGKRRLHDDTATEGGVTITTMEHADKSKKLTTPGSLDYCPMCGSRFSITKYTTMTSYGGLCHRCGANAKNAAAPSKRQAPAAKRPRARRTQQEDPLQKTRAMPSLQGLCIDIISEHIDDVEELIGVGGQNMELICRSISKNRRLNDETIQLFLEPGARALRFYDCSAVHSEALQSFATFAPNVEEINLQLCGNLDSAALDKWCAKLRRLRRVELYGPFLVRAEAWHRFFECYREQLESFKIRETPRFDLGCCKKLVECCPDLRELGLAQIGPLDAGCLEVLGDLRRLTYLDVSDPGVSAPGVPPKSLEDGDVVKLLSRVGAELETLVISGNAALTGESLVEGVLAHCASLQRLGVAGLSQDAERLAPSHFVRLFDGLAERGRPGLRGVDAQRCAGFDDAALASLLRHSSETLEELNVNSCDRLSADALRQLGRRCARLRKLDVGFCRSVTDEVVEEIVQGNEEVAAGGGLIGLGGGGADDGAAAGAGGSAAQTRMASRGGGKGGKGGSLREVWIFACNKTTRFLRSPSPHVRIVGRERPAALAAA